MIELQHVSAGYGGKPVLRDISLTVRPGEVLVLAGPNGCGKSTLLRTALGLQPSLGGRVLADGQDIAGLTPGQIARKAAFLAQSRNVPDITAGRLVLHGRFPYLGCPRRYRQEDLEAARKALAWAGALELAERPMPELSGGQRQKVYLAMALAQDTETILMDEPTTFLDIRRQLELMSLVRRLAKEGRAVAMVLHDVCLALAWADRIALLYQGGLLDCGSPEEIFQRGRIEEAFGVRLGRIATEDGPQYYCRGVRNPQEGIK